MRKSRTARPAPIVKLNAPELEPEQMAVPETVVLEASLIIRDMDKAHRQLMTALATEQSVILDVSRIGTIDTAGVQLLLAFENEAVKRSIAIEYHGESAVVKRAFACLGLGNHVLAGTKP